MQPHEGEDRCLQDLDEPVDLHKGFNAHAHLPENPNQITGMLIRLQESLPVT